MKICLSGTHGTGKTTVATMFAEQYDYTLVTSISREVLKLGYPINQNATVESQALISMGRIAQCLENGPDFITDRGPIDSLAYNMYQLENDWHDNDAAHYWHKIMETITARYMSEYDLLVYVPITFPLVADGVRATQDDYQKEIDENVKFYFDRLNLNVVKMPAGTPQQRVDWLSTYVCSHPSQDWFDKWYEAW